MCTRDLHTRCQQLHEGPRDKLVNNLVVKSPKAPPLAVGMADRNEDDLNGHARRTLPDLARAAWQGENRAYAETARPTADLVLPALSEHTLGQLMQMLMLATVVEARLMGVNPYSQPGAEPAERHARSILKAMGESGVVRPGERGA